MKKLVLLLILSYLVTLTIQAQDKFLPLERFINFDSDEYRIPDSYYPTLDSVIAMYRSVSLSPGTSLGKIKVIGHTDNKGSDDYNNVLSIKRAEAVYTYLVMNGVSASSIEYSAYGESAPITENKDDKSRYINRRVEVSTQLPKWMPQQKGTAKALGLKFYRTNNLNTLTLGFNEDAIITGENGVQVIFAPNAIPMTKKPELDAVDLKLTSYYTKKDLILAGMPTVTEDKILETGSVVCIGAWSGGTEVNSFPDSAISVVLPADRTFDDMTLFASTGHQDDLTWHSMSTETPSYDKSCGCLQVKMSNLGCRSMSKELYAGEYKVIAKFKKLKVKKNKNKKFSVYMTLDDHNSVIPGRKVGKRKYELIHFKGDEKVTLVGVLDLQGKANKAAFQKVELDFTKSKKSAKSRTLKVKAKVKDVGRSELYGILSEL